MNGKAEKLGAALRVLLATIWMTALAACTSSTSTEPDLTGSPADSLALLRASFDEPEACQSCHPNHYAEWQTSMHAYAFVDPIFFALNAIGQQRSNQQLDQFCVKCHSPLGSLLQETPVGFNLSSLSGLAKQGIHCDVCHTIKTFESGKSVSSFRLDGVKQGPIADAAPNSFHQSAFDSRYSKSAMCSPCHDVRTPAGIQVEFTSTEWQNSPYTAMGLECQGCHMPTYSGQAAVGGPERTELHRHTFIGVDVPLVDFPGRDETIARVEELLQNSVTMEVNAPNGVSSTGALTVDVTVTNDRAGHNIPTGTIFERQMWLEVLVEDANQGTIYASGSLDANGDLLDHHSEVVKAGASADSDLTLFNGTPIKNGNETLFFWEADRIEQRTIPPFDNRTANYSISGPFTTEVLNLSVKLRFRSFPPYLLREIDKPELIEHLPIFDMETFETQITVTN